MKDVDDGRGDARYACSGCDDAAAAAGGDDDDDDASVRSAESSPNIPGGGAAGFVAPSGGEGVACARCCPARSPRLLDSFGRSSMISSSPSSALHQPPAVLTTLY